MGPRVAYPAPAKKSHHAPSYLEHMDDVARVTPIVTSQHTNSCFDHTCIEGHAKMLEQQAATPSGMHNKSSILIQFAPPKSKCLRNSNESYGIFVTDQSSV